jgi:hypothetical protein
MLFNLLQLVVRHGARRDMTAKSQEKAQAL